MDQILTVKCLCEKFREKGREVYIAFIDLEKAYDLADREALWKVLSKYEVSGKLMDEVRCFYADNRASKTRKLIVNGGKSKVMIVGSREGQRELRISLGRGR